MRLNWGGRVKKKTKVGEDGSEQINFSSGMITLPKSRPTSRDSTTTPTTPNVPLHGLSYTSQPSTIKAEEYVPLPPNIAYSTALEESASQYAQQLPAAMNTEGYCRLPHDSANSVALVEVSPQYAQPTTATVNAERYVRLPQNATYVGGLQESALHYAEQPSAAMNIDPALMRPGPLPTVIYEGKDYGTVYGRPDPQYTQSYERYRSLTPLSGPPPPVARFRQTQSLEESFSPIDSGIGSPNVSNFSGRSVTLSNVESPNLTPPFYGNGKDEGDVSIPDIVSYDRPTKRVRYQAGQDAISAYDTRMPPPNLTSLTSYNVESQTSSILVAAPANSVGTPLTPASSLSDDGYTKAYPAKTSPHGAQESPDLRRLSVSSLLSGPPGMAYNNDRNYVPRSNPEVQDWSVQYQDVYQDTTTWGIDRGIKDLDIGKNDDMNAITGASPIAMRDHLELVLDEDGELMPIEFGFGMEMNNTAFENGGYYDKPVAICIPRVLEPLPSKLLENPMNLLVSSFPLSTMFQALIVGLVLCELSNYVILGQH
jgi:hypothetical protein